MQGSDQNQDLFMEDHCVALKHGGKRLRAEFEGSQSCSGSPKATFIMRYTRVKEVGTRLKNQLDLRNKRILEIAAPLPEHNRLTARAVYWFVSTEDVEIMFEDRMLFIWKEKLQVASEDGTVHYLNQIDFAKNKKGIIAFKSSNGEMVTVQCCSTKMSTSRKRAKLASPTDNKFPDMEIDDESQSAELNDQGLIDNDTKLSTNPPIPQQDTTGEALTDLSGDSSWICSADSAQYVQHSPQVLHDGTQLAASEALIVNVLLLVPDSTEYIELVEKALIEIGFVKEVSSDNQLLFSEKSLVKKKLHVLVFPYGKMNKYIRIQDRLHFASEVLLILENGAEQLQDLAAIERVTNVNGTSDTWQLAMKKTNLTSVTVDYTTLKRPAQLLFSIDELRQAILGGVSYNQYTTPPLSEFLLQWNLGPCSRRVPQNIYLCFTYEPTVVKPFTEYAAITLAALGISCETFVARGSVRVYLRCPSYVMWHLMLRHEEVFRTLRAEGLTNVFECGILDVDMALMRAKNEEHLDELTYLQELMVCDGVEYLPNWQRRTLFERTSQVRRLLFDTDEDEITPEKPTTNVTQPKVIFVGSADDMIRVLSPLMPFDGTALGLPKGATYQVTIDDLDDEAVKKELIKRMYHQQIQNLSQEPGTCNYKNLSALATKLGEPTLTTIYYGVGREKPKNQQ